MREQIIWFAASILIASPAWTAPKDSDSNREEAIGVGSGAVIGAVAGGPIGVIIGAALGGWAGDRMNRERTAREDFEDRFIRASADLETLESMLTGSEREVEELQAALSLRETTYRDALSDALDIHVFFHTGQAELDDATKERLARLGRVIKALDGFSVVIEGHADARGDADYNVQLSAERAAVVRAALIDAGLQPDRISSRASGERFSTADETDLDSLALERRVDLSVNYPSNRVAQQ